ncbi:HNH endonuclease [Cellulomonas sp. PS-H5]|uniref:HNH endonuclease n=1 Tax=Cellulomonas sp. PS-H5 TaxID=2820400 RepID=UPI001C4ECD57|nr:HNH endonuclease signature motif containing protein [Cellulomonas sp. PS-H5]MBW0255816.1 HNH endonuclease [Cellulomonas sp. PS-H5]
MTLPAPAYDPAELFADAAALAERVPAWGSGLLALVVLARGRRARWRRRDPQRWFDAYQRAAGRARAGGRCEYTAAWSWQRCPAASEQADHFRPWARGGATEPENLVAACVRHNQSKGGRMPTLLTTAVITWRRRRYFPAGVPRRPGAWYRGSRR